MILKMTALNGIKAGTISLQFRKWKKPTVRKGSRIKTALGVIEITDVEEIATERISNEDAVQAGYNERKELLDGLNKIAEGKTYKIGVRYYSEDPRIALRENTDVSDKDLDAIKQKLERLDKYSKEGSWTLKVLHLIRDNPQVRAADLARKMKKEKNALKVDIRKLKNLGLTISHEVGYSISPLGEKMLERMADNESSIVR